jgi:hypothetical protein
MRAKGAPREISQEPPRLTLRPPIDPRRRPPRRRDERAKQAIFKIAGMTRLIHIGNDLLSPSRRRRPLGDKSEPTAGGGKRHKQRSCKGGLAFASVGGGNEGHFVAAFRFSEVVMNARARSQRIAVALDAALVTTDIATTVPSSARFLPRGVSGNTAATVNSPLWRLATPAAVIGIVLMQLFLVWARRRKDASKTLCST